jgi:hypothetical protein
MVESVASQHDQRNRVMIRPVLILWGRIRLLLFDTDDHSTVEREKKGSSRSQKTLTHHQSTPNTASLILFLRILQPRSAFASLRRILRLTGVWNTVLVYRGSTSSRSTFSQTLPCNIQVSTIDCLRRVRRKLRTVIRIWLELLVIFSLENTLSFNAVVHASYSNSWHYWKLRTL